MVLLGALTSTGSKSRVSASTQTHIKVELCKPQEFEIHGKQMFSPHRGSPGGTFTLEKTKAKQHDAVAAAELLPVQCHCAKLHWAQAKLIWMSNCWASNPICSAPGNQGSKPTLFPQTPLDQLIRKYLSTHRVRWAAPLRCILTASWAVLALHSGIPTASLLAENIPLP